MDGAHEDSTISTDELPPFLAEMRDRDLLERRYSTPYSDTQKNNSEEGSDNFDPWLDPEVVGSGDYTSPMEDFTSKMTQQEKSFWDRFQPTVARVRKEKGRMKNLGKGILTSTVFLGLMAILVFVVLQQFSAGELLKVTALAILFITPYIATFLMGDLVAYWRKSSEHSWGFGQRFNTIVGPGIVSLAISSCIFSAPLERKVWIIGNATTGANGTLYAVPIFSKITGITKDQEITVDVSGKTADGIMVNSRITTTVVCCADNPEQIISLYAGGKAKPEDVMKNYLVGIFDGAFKKSVENARAAEIRSAYASMAKRISRRQIREDTALLWNGKFSVIESRAELSTN